jgi:hypothetical protein
MQRGSKRTRESEDANLKKIQKLSVQILHNEKKIQKLLEQILHKQKLLLQKQETNASEHKEVISILQEINQILKKVKLLIQSQ